MYMVIRLPNNPATMMQFMILEDTGSSIMSMYPQDIWQLQARPGGGAAVPSPLLGATGVRYKLYTGSAPDGSGKTWAFDQKGGWNGIPVPRARMRDRRRPYHHAQYLGPNNAIRAFQAAVKTAPIYEAPLAILPATPHVGRPPGSPKRPPPGVRIGPNPPLSRQPPLQQPLPALKIAGAGGGAGS
jgi:hypothetical protein